MYRAPTQEQKDNYNESIRQKLQNQRYHERTESFIKAIKEAAEEELEKVDPEQKKHYLSESTWKLIKQKEEANDSF